MSTHMFSWRNKKISILFGCLLEYLGYILYYSKHLIERTHKHKKMFCNEYMFYSMYNK